MEKAQFFQKIIHNPQDMYELQNKLIIGRCFKLSTEYTLYSVYLGPTVSIFITV